MKAGYSRQRNTRSYSLKKPVAGLLPGIARSRPSHNSGGITTNAKESGQHGSGGYKPVANALDQELNPVAGTYHDFIHFNYGAESQRQHRPSGSQEQ